MEHLLVLVGGAFLLFTVTAAAATAVRRISAAVAATGRVYGSGISAAVCRLPPARHLALFALEHLLHTETEIAPCAVLGRGQWTAWEESCFAA